MPTDYKHNINDMKCHKISIRVAIAKVKYYLRNSRIQMIHNSCDGHLQLCDHCSTVLL